jgi:ATP/maltotriose-dependent transcriptional regulator MalT
MNVTEPVDSIDGARIPGLPRLSPHLVDRPRLDAPLLDAMAGESQVICVWGAAGTGKTTLLSGWARRAAAQGHRVAWFDGSAAASLRSALPSLLQHPDATTDAQGQLQFIVIDDVHAVAAKIGRAQLYSLIEAPPSHVRLILAGRYQPFGSLAFLDAAGVLRELRNHDLAFTEPETAALSREHGLELSDSAIGSLVRRVGGWATALVLAVPWLHDTDDASLAVDRFSGDNRAVADYLVTEVVEGTTRDEREIMMSASVAEAVPLELLVALSGRHDAGEVMHRLSQKNSLIMETADGYRYHPVFHSFLAAESRRRGTPEDAERHAKAALWYSERGLAREALQQATASGDDSVISDALQSFGLELILTGDSVPVSRAVGHFRAGQPLIVTLMRLLAEMPFLGAAPLAAHLLAQAEDAASVSNDISQRTRGILFVLRALAAGGTIEAASALTDLAGEPMSSVRHQSTALELLAATAESWCLDLLGRTWEAEAVLGNVRAASLRSGFDWLFLITTELASSVASRAGHWAQSLTLEDQMAAKTPTIAVAKLDRVGASSLIATAAQHYRRCDPMPIDALEQVIGADPFGVQFGVLSAAQVFALAPRLDSDANPREAFEALTEIVRADGAKFPRLSAAFCTRLAVISSTLDGRNGVRDLLSTFEQILGADSLEFQVMQFIGDPPTRSRGPAEEALEAELAHPKLVWHPATMVSAWVELASIAESSGRVAIADSRLIEAVRLAQQYKTPRPFFARGWETIALLEPRMGRFGHLDAFAARILEIATGILPATQSDRPFGDLLTVREREILNELPVHQSVAEIARRQSLSINTVKTHLRNIYQKLGAADRGEAVAAAHKQGLL